MFCKVHMVTSNVGHCLMAIKNIPATGGVYIMGFRNKLEGQYMNVHHVPRHLRSIPIQNREYVSHGRKR